MARPWNPDFTHSDRERWICIYPAYVNSKKTTTEGRRIPKNRAVENPTHAEIRDVIVSAGLTLGVENKVYPREDDPRDAKFRGRVRVQLKNDDGTAILPEFPTRKSVLLYIGDTIPKLKMRQGSAAAPGSSQQQGGGGGSGGGGGKRKRGKKK